ncbi:glycoside hydrolase family protein [Herbiconiux daphne]|uniref:Glycosyl hydrolase n=1 Tax=Herbiconiux daphne TaxID=2970914 RepID=A0ABT2H3V3_9MICO|nr:hypothetical protein [Herbiconiux daphne]MCS5734619.1 hypothetical protein [Herbiconiux daphne]
MSQRPIPTKPSPVPKPLFRDPVFDGAADPVLVWNRHEQAWWMVYTARRAWGPELPGVEWMHGTDLGVASTPDGGLTWLYRGTIAGLDLGWGRDTYWAPEIIDDGSRYHMYVSVVTGVPDRWPGHPRRIRHYTSDDLVRWAFVSTLDLSSDRVIDAAVAPLPGGGHRMWFKDEADDSHTWAADSPDLATWTVVGPVLTHAPHEGPNVFPLGGWWWMIVDEWNGQRVFRSHDLAGWTAQGLILDQPGRGPDDSSVGHHADVVPTSDSMASIFYFTHPGRQTGGPLDTVAERRSSIQVARVRVVDGTLVCNRDEVLTGPVLPPDGPGSAP